jgi:hypothetical protein
MKNLYKIYSPLKYKRFINLEILDFSETLPSPKDTKESGNYFTEMFEDATVWVKDIPEKSWEYIKKEAENLSEEFKELFLGLLESLGDSFIIPIFDAAIETATRVIGKEKSNKLALASIEEYRLENFLMLDACENLSESNEKGETTKDRITFLKSIADPKKNKELYEKILKLDISDEARMDILLAIDSRSIGKDLQNRLIRNEDELKKYGIKTKKGEKETIEETATRLTCNFLSTSRLDKDGKIKNDEITKKIKDILGEEEFGEFVKDYKISINKQEERIDTNIRYANGDITEMEAQIELDEQIETEIASDPEGYAGFVEILKIINANKSEELYESQGSNKEISREKIYKSVECAQESGLNSGFINGVGEIDDDGNTVFALNEITVIKGIDVGITLKVSPEGKTTLETDFNDPLLFSNKEELKGIIKLIQYNAIISQIINYRGGDNTELERKMSDKELQGIVTEFEKVNCKGQNRYEVFKEICENLFINKATASEKKEFGRYLHKTFVGNITGGEKSTSQTKIRIQGLVDAAVSALKNGNETDVSKDTKLGNGTQVEFNPENP